MVEFTMVMTCSHRYKEKQGVLMKTSLAILALGLSACCSSLFKLPSSTADASPAVDPSPAWDAAGRYAVEMKTDCNLSQLSNKGIAGCAFREKEIAGNLTLPSLWAGTLSFVSYNCKNFTQAASADADNVIQLQDMYTAKNHGNCNFDITRTVRDGKVKLDRPILGRFGIKIIKDNEYYSALKFAVNDELYNGIGWYQRSEKQTDATLLLYPTGAKGDLSIRCGKDLTLQQSYDSVPIIINLDSAIDCDYEIEVTNANGPEIEEATYMHMTHGYTEEVTAPLVTYHSIFKRMEFSFKERDLSGRKHVVVAVQVDNKKCLNDHECSVPHTKNTYDVKGLTPGGRVFSGTYDTTTGTWRTK